MGNKIPSKVIKELKKSKMYSVLADAIPDVAHKDQMTAICRYIDETGQPRERLFI